MTDQHLQGSERPYGVIACAVIGVLIGLVTFALGLNVLDVFHG